MIHVLPDDFFGFERLAEIRATCGPADLLTLNTSELDGQRLTAEELESAAGSLPFLAEKRLVIVRRLLSTAEGKSAEAPTAGRRQAARDERAEGIAAYLKLLPESTELVFLEQRVPAKGSANPVFKEIVRLKGEVLEVAAPRPADVIDWAIKRARKKGGKIRPDAAARLGVAVGDDLWRLDTEIDKLLTYTAGAEITAADVHALVPEARDDNIFHLVDAIGRRDRRQALALLHQLLDSGSAPQYILIMITRQARLLLQVREALAETSDPTTVAQRTRLSPWQVRNLTDQARRFTIADLESFYHQLLAADQAIKTGRVEGDLALDLLTAEAAGER